MSRPTLQQSLSALMDNETSELELHQLLAQSGDTELRSQWTRWQIARAALHREPQQVVSTDLASRVSAALATEPAQTFQKQQAIRTRPRWLAGAGQLALAASVVVAILGGVRIYQHTTLDTPPALVQQPQKAPGMPPFMLHPPVQWVGYGGAPQPALSGLPEVSADITNWQVEQLSGHLRQHSRQTARHDGIDGMLPYARAASFSD